MLRFLLLVFLAIPATLVSAQDYVFTIGNSLTNDTKPRDLNDSQWHIYCSKNLDFIFNNPYGHCVETSTAWPDAFQNNQFKFVTVQPFEGTTLKRDCEIISLWMQLQPEAVFVLHAGWTAASGFPIVYNAGLTDHMLPTPEYMSELKAALQVIHPGRLIVETRSNDLLYSVWEDIENNVKPFTDFREDLYRDFIHMDLHTGRYLMHQAMRYAIRQPLFDQENFPSTTQQEFYYLNQKLIDVVVVLGDMNRDRVCDLLDIDLFIDLLSKGGFDIAADIDRDGIVGLTDIQGFVDLLQAIDD